MSGNKGPYMKSHRPSVPPEPGDGFPPSSPEKTGPETGSVRLHKLLAHRGVASRRKAEQLIASGLVSVNGQTVIEPGTRVNPLADTVLVEGKPLRRESDPFLFLFYKPRGVVSTLHDPEGRPTLREFFPNIEPLLHVGRLDFQTEGALLLTNNGDLSQRILHPRYAIPRTYLVKIQGGISPAHMERIARGDIRLDGRAVIPLEFVPERDTDSNAWYRITLTEGRNREVRRLFETLNYFVLKLVRTAFGPLTLAGLDPGEYRTVTAAEIRALLAGETPTHIPRTIDSRHRDSDTQSPRTRLRPARSRESFETPPSRRGSSEEEGSTTDRSSRRSSSFPRSSRNTERGRPGKPFSGERPSPQDRSNRPSRTFRDEEGSRSGRRSGSSPGPSRNTERPGKLFSGERPSPQDRSNRPSRTFRDDEGSRSGRRSGSSPGPSRNTERPGKPFSGERPSPQDRSNRPSRTFRNSGAPSRGEDRPFTKGKKEEDSRPQKQENKFSNFRNRKSAPKGRGGKSNPSRPKKA